MRLIKLLDYNEESMQLGKSIYDAQGRVLLAANNKIHPKFVDRLITMGISHIVVEDAESRGITLEEMLDLPTWLDIIQIVKIGYESIGHKKPLPLKNILQGVNKLIDEVKIRPVLIPIPITTISVELQLYAHAVNVTLLALQMAKHLGYNDLQLRDLAVGCLLHDIGKCVTNDQSKHSELGFNIIRNIREISLLSAHVAFQHHEKFDGTGYPRGISGKDIHEYAQICSVADTYDNLLSKVKMLPHEAVEVIMALNGTSFTSSIVDAFVKAIAPYPPGSKVMLNNGERAIVTKIESQMQRPIVRYLSSEQEISLAEHHTLMIISV
ncbi:HD-GYP domain-containing protein [Paenibacillus sp. CMAA1364]